MDPIFIIIVVVLIGLSIMDLSVGVANDAVNFLNSSIGSKVAPFWVILFVASAGVMLGTFFSSGMMEIARSGVFHPEMFSFESIMLLFLAVMLTDVILLDVFNSMGLPTSTTVSLVFELLGSAVAVALYSIWSSGSGVLAEYINSGKALAIISGIFVSVAIAFTVGSLVMYVTRIVFSFQYKKSLKYFGAIWAGIALTAMTYFIVFKGLKGSPFMANEGVSNFLDYINHHMLYALLVTFVSWAILMELLQLLFKINVLKIVVLTGTLALALAFASNDLVNFIGVPLAALDSFMAAKSAGGSLDSMGMLNGAVQANPWILLTSGMVMVLALVFSKKARSVTETEVNLGRQDAGIERFSSTPLSRSIVRAGVNANKFLVKVVPQSVRNKIDSRFVLPDKDSSDSPEGASFDLVRASVNLTLAALLISLGTSLKLPLSTTYVTFMVAMGTSLADRAWGRESAVYRVTGVLTVIGGWFITAIIAFTCSLLMGFFLVGVGKIAVFLAVALVVYILIKSSQFHKKRTEAAKDNAQLIEDEHGMIVTSTTDVREAITSMLEIYHQNIKALTEEDRILLRKMASEARELYQGYRNKRAYEVVPTIQYITSEELDIEQEYVQIVDYTYEISKALRVITSESYLYIDNNHKGFSEEQEADLEGLSQQVTHLYTTFLDMMDKKDYTHLDSVVEIRDNIIEQTGKLTKKQIRRVKKGDSGTRNSILFMNILNETKTIVLQSTNLMRSQYHLSATVKKLAERRAAAASSTKE